ncbi:MAG: VOC family protein [Chloroflexi bacterium]|nr:VOC family protein [Chloroflexota bacterium]
MPKIVHLAVKVDNLPEAREFYEAVFGLRHTETSSKRGHTSCHMTDGTFDLALIKYESEQTIEADWAGPGPRLHHFGVVVEDVAKAEAELRRRGCEILSKPGVTPIKFRAPGGIVAEVGAWKTFPGAEEKPGG